MTDTSRAPERIWADSNAERDIGSWGLDREFDDDVEYVRADRIEELEAKLAKAVEALQQVQAFVSDLEPYADQGHTLVPALREACETLKEIKGETDA